MVKLAFDVGITNLWLEGDSNNIINSIKGISPTLWLIGNLIEETRDTLVKFENVYVTHVLREANPGADWFANKGVGSDKLLIWHSGKDILVEEKSLIDLEKI